MDKPATPKHRARVVHCLGWLAVVCILIAGTELSAYVFLKLLSASPVKHHTYLPPSLPECSEYENYLQARHPHLGWPPGRQGTANPRSRSIPAIALPAEDCLTAYGDSYVFGSDVTAGEAWSNILSRRLGCRVGNFGVPAYGTGQAFLRFKLNENDSAPVTYLGIYANNFKRSVNQLRPFISGSGKLDGFKPRYYLEQGQLRLASIPQIAYDNLPTFLADPGDFLAHESFLPGSDYGPVPIRFPFSFAAASVITKDELRNWYAGRPSWTSYIEPGHPLQTLELTLTIVENFVSECRGRNKRCFIVLIPTKSEFDYLQQSGKRAVQPLLDGLAESAVPFLDITAAMHRDLGEKSICRLLLGDDCRGHFNAEGNRMMADYLFAYLTDNGLLEQANRNSR